jgi:NAD(P)-dependent dehydrogenase (short-subunit alcohol dehydrogenase family)
MVNRNGKVAIVTGSASGIGQTAAITLAAAGAVVVQQCDAEASAGCLDPCQDPGLRARAFGSA